MKDGPDIARVASLIGDPARANMLGALMSGCALSAGELAQEAGVTASTASTHLARLHGGGLVTERRDGRHRYYALSGPPVARLVEHLMDLANTLGHRRARPGGRAPALKCARVCYDHLAGERGVWMHARLHAMRVLVPRAGRLCLTRAGRDFVGDFGIDFAVLAGTRRSFAHPCRDWSEQDEHLAGSLGAAFLDRFYDLGWASREAGTRVVRFTRRGEARFEALFA